MELSELPPTKIPHLASLLPYVWSATIVSLVSAGLWALADHLSPIDVPLGYIIAVLICAAVVGRGPALLAAGLSFLAFKFFFVPPIFSLSITDVRDAGQLLFFVTAALIGGAVTVRAREQAALARRQAHETTVLYQLSQTISAELDFNQIAPLIVYTTRQLLPGTACRLLLVDEHGAQPPLVQHGAWPAGQALVTAPLRSGATTLGQLQIALPPQHDALSADQIQLLETLASQAALAFERSRLAHEAARAEVLAESDRLKSTLLSAVSHDLRTPLASITAAADELLADDVRWSPRAMRDFAQLISSEARRLNHLVTNMLDLTRIEAGVLRPQRGWYNIAEIVYRVLPRFALDLDGRPLRLNLPDDLPLVPVDYLQLEQVLGNLIENALKYSPPGSPIVIDACQHEGHLLLRIGDRGPGIPPPERSRVFEKFYRLPQSEGAAIPGAGIGLAICKGLIEGNGGQIMLRDHSGGGTLVEIRMPMQVAEVLAHEEAVP